jgi:hypothetical protein
MVPEPLWGKNLRSNEGLGRYRWDKLRKAIMAERGKSCVICGSDDQPHGHEVWEYQETKKTGIARLIGVEIVCRDCHAIHHWGRTTRLLLERAITLKDIRRLMKHFCTTNGCKQRDFDRHADEALVIWKRRSKLEWQIDWGVYADAVRDAQRTIPERKAEADRQAIIDGDGPPKRSKRFRRQLGTIRGITVIDTGERIRKSAFVIGGKDKFRARVLKFEKNGKRLPIEALVDVLFKGGRSPERQKAFLMAEAKDCIEGWEAECEA